MGAVFFLGFALCWMGGSLITGIVSLILCLRKRPSPISWIAGAVSAVSFIAFLIPVLFLGYLAVMNATVPDDYTDTGIYVDDPKFGCTRFTANGTTYVRIPTPGNIQIAEPVYSIKYKGWYNRAQWSNYYRFENDGGFDLVGTRSYSIFCAESQLIAACDYYNINKPSQTEDAP